MDPKKWEELDTAIDDFKEAIAKGAEGRVVTERAELLATAATAALEDHDADQLAGHEGRENGPPGARPARVVLFTNEAQCDHCGQAYPARITLSSDPEEAIATCALVVLLRCRCGATKPIGLPAKK
jgi:hypothetical protein